MELLRGVLDLKNGEPSTVPDFFGFTNWNEVVEFLLRVVRVSTSKHL